MDVRPGIWGTASVSASGTTRNSAGRRPAGSTIDLEERGFRIDWLAANMGGLKEVRMARAAQLPGQQHRNITEEEQGIAGSAEH